MFTIEKINTNKSYNKYILYFKLIEKLDNVLSIYKIEKLNNVLTIIKNLYYSNKIISISYFTDIKNIIHEEFLNNDLKGHYQFINIKSMLDVCLDLIIKLESINNCYIQNIQIFYDENNKIDSYNNFISYCINLKKYINIYIFFLLNKESKLNIYNVNFDYNDDDYYDLLNLNIFNFQNSFINTNKELIFVVYKIIYLTLLIYKINNDKDYLLYDENYKIFKTYMLNNELANEHYENIIDNGFLIYLNKKNNAYAFFKKIYENYNENDDIKILYDKSSTIYKNFINKNLYIM